MRHTFMSIHPTPAIRAKDMTFVDLIDSARRKEDVLR